MLKYKYIFYGNISKLSINFSLFDFTILWLNSLSCG